MKIIDPLAPTVLFLGFGWLVLVSDAGINGLAYAILAASTLAIVFGSIIWFQRESADRRAQPERK